MRAQIERGLIGPPRIDDDQIVPHVELDLDHGAVVRGLGPHRGLIGDDEPLLRRGDPDRGRGRLGPLGRGIAVGSREVPTHLGYPETPDGDLGHVVGAQARSSGPGQVGDGPWVVPHHQRAHRVHRHRVGPRHDQPHRGLDERPAGRPIRHPPQAVHHREVRRSGQVQVDDVTAQVVGAVAQRALVHPRAGAVVDVGRGDAELVLEGQRHARREVVLQHRHRDKDVRLHHHAGEPVGGLDQAVGDRHLGHEGGVVLIQPTRIVQVHQRHAGLVVQEVPVGIVAAATEGIQRRPALVPVLPVARCTVGDDHLTRAGLLDQADHRPHDAGVGGVPLVGMASPDQVRLDHDGVPRLDDPLQSPRQGDRLPDQRLDLLVGHGPGVGADDGDGGRAGSGAGEGGPVLQAAHRRQEGEEGQDDRKSPISTHL